MIRRCDGGEGAGGVGYLRLLAALSTFLFGMCIPLRVGAQCDDAWVNVTASPIHNNATRAVLALPDGDVVVGGSFTSSSMLPNVPYIQKFHPSTNTWSPMGQGITNWVYALARRPDGSLVAGGYQGVWMYDPASDAWTSVGGTVNGYVYAVMSLPDGDFVVGGSFTSIGGVAANRVARYSTSTQTWAALGGGADGPVNALLLRSEGEFVVGGDFNHVNGLLARGIARYVPTTGTWIGSAANGPGVQSMVETPDGRVLVGRRGFFFDLNQVLLGGVALWTPESDTWTPVGGGTDANVYQVMINAAGEYVVAGFFGNPGIGLPGGGISARSIAKFSPATQTWSTLNFSPTVTGTIFGFAILSDGDIVVAGLFQTVDSGFLAQNFGRFSHLTNTWMAATSGVTSPVYSLAQLPSGEIVAGGALVAVGGMRANHIARFDPVYNIWRPMGAGVDGNVWAVATTPSGDVFAGGEFLNAGGSPASRVAMYQSDTQSWQALGAGVDGTVTALAVSPSRVLYVGGTFANAGGAPAANIAAYDLDAQTWSPLNAGTDGQVRAITVLPDGRIVVSGTFSHVGGLAANNIAVYSPSAGMWEALGGGQSGSVYSTVVMPNGDLVAASVGVTYTSITRFSFGRGTWQEVTRTNGSVRSLATLPNGDLLATGFSFAASPTSSVQAIGYYAMATGTWHSLGANNAGLPLYGLIAAPTGEVFVGGNFSSFAGNSAYNFAKHSAGPPRIGMQPGDVVACPDEPVVSIPVGAVSISACTYQWRKDGSDIDVGANPSAATATLILRDVQASDAAMYDCVVTNPCGQSTTEPATLSMRAAGDPACAPACDPDVNQDGVADQGDVDYLINVIAGGENPNNANADFNNDGVADQGDVDALINVIAGGACP